MAKSALSIAIPREDARGTWSRSTTPAVWALVLALYLIAILGARSAGADLFWLADLAWTAAAAVAAFASWRTAGRLKGAMRTAWVLFAAACLAWLLGQLVWDWLELVRGARSPFPSLADIGYHAYNILMALALVSLWAMQPDRRLTPIRCCNLTLVICAFAVVFVCAAYEPIAHAALQPLHVGVIVAQVIERAALVVLVIYVLWSYHWKAVTRPLALIALSTALHCAAALGYLQPLVLGEYETADALSVLWLAVFGVHHWAAIEQRHVREERFDEADEYRYMGYFDSVLPALLLVGMGVAGIVFREHISPRVLWVAGFCFLLFASVLAVRETSAFGRDLHVRARLKRSNNELERARDELHRAIGELRETDKRLRLAAITGRVGLWEWNLRTNTVDYSLEWKRPTDARGTDDFESFTSAVHPDDRERVLSSLQAYIAHPSGEYSTELRMQRRDGSWRWVIGRGTLLLDERGAPERMIGSMIDITQRKEMENELRRSEQIQRELAAQLEMRVAQRTCQLQDAYQELEGYSYAIAHDLKAPLRAIDGFSGLLQQSADPKLSEEERGFVARVRRGALQMADLIEGLLDYARMERRELQPSLVDLRALVDGVLSAHEPEIAARGVQIRLDVPPLMLRLDREGLGLILRNLVQNALKFTRTRTSPCIEIGARLEPERMLVWVKDNGVGFAAEHHDEIFRIFSRLNRPDEYEGSGVGLALAHKASQRMQGRLWADSKPGEGATFCIQLPARVVESV